MKHREKTEDNMGKVIVQVQDAQCPYTFLSSIFCPGLWQTMEIIHKVKRLPATFTHFFGWTAPKHPQVKGCGAVRCVSFPAFISCHWLFIGKKPELCCSLQTAEDLAWLSGCWEISSFYRDGTENHHHYAVCAPAQLQESLCHLSCSKGKFPFESCGNLSNHS